jgi:hypothetical protein
MNNVELLESEMQSISEGLSTVEREYKRALDLLDQLYKAPLLNDTNAIIEVENKVKAFLKENGRTV